MSTYRQFIQRIFEAHDPSAGGHLGPGHTGGGFLASAKRRGHPELKALFAEIAQEILVFRELEAGDHNNNPAFFKFNDRISNNSVEVY